MKIKVATLTGPLLDKWVGKANGLDVQILCDRPVVWNGAVYYYYSPSTDWLIGGAILEREGYKTYRSGAGDWCCLNYNSPHEGKNILYGDTLLIAAMRCFVTCKFGEEVEE